MTEIENFIYQYEENQHKVMLFLHNCLTEDLNLTEKIRFNIPFYFGKSWVCYINPTKNGSVEFAFVRGNELSNEQGLLDNKGRKQVYSIEFKHVKDIPKQTLNEIIQEAILLDETTPYKSKRNVKKIATEKSNYHSQTLVPSVQFWQMSISCRLVNKAFLKPL